MYRTPEQAQPPGSDHPHWITVRTTRTVLIVVHTMTAWNRLSDILPVFDSDRRVQLVFTFPDVSHVTGDVERHLDESGARRIPWSRALTDKFDLAISVRHSGELHRISAPLAVLSHGIGYTKIARESRIENRESRIENVYGLGRRWLVREGSIPEAVILPHENDRHRLALTVPEALPHAVVAGDPCFDRMRASRHLVPTYRAALGATPDTTVVTVSSTWGPGSVLGQHPNLIDDLLSELTLDDHVIAAIVHPNVWFAHGPLQLRTWFADALRAGLRLIPPISGWQQTVLAADLVIGDHGAVTGYAAAHGIPTALAAFPREEVADGSVMDLLGDLAPSLNPLRPLPTQIRRAINDFDPAAMREVSTQTTSHPGACLDTLRSTFYRLLKLPEPHNPPPQFPYPAQDLTQHSDPIRACWISCDTDSLGHRTARVHRWPADVTARSRRGHRTTDAALVVYADHPRRDLTGTADILVVSNITHDPDESLTRTLRQHPGCSIAMTEIDPHHVLLRFRDGSTAEALLDDTPTAPMPTAFLAALLHLDREAADYTILAGAHRMTFSLKHIGPATD